MKSYNNLPSQQHQVQRLIDQFNDDERLWQRLESKRRRKLSPSMSDKLHKQLDLLEFAKARPPQDCIGVKMLFGQAPYREGIS